MSNSPIRILIVDDNSLYRETLAHDLDAFDDFEVVASFDDARQAIEWLRTSVVDVVLMDIEMPRMDGIEATATIMTAHPDLKVVMLTAFGDEIRTNQALSVGACSFLEKNRSIQDIARGIHTALSGYQVIPRWPDSTATPTSTSGMKDSDYEANADFQRKFRQLSPVHQQIVAAIARGMSNREVSVKAGLSESSVRTYVSSILQTCGCHSRTGLAIKATRAGCV